MYLNLIDFLQIRSWTSNILRQIYSKRLIVRNVLRESAEDTCSKYQMDFVVWLPVHPLEWKYWWWGENMLSLIGFKEIWLILQILIYFAYTIEARFEKHAFMIHLSILMMATFRILNSFVLGSEFMKFHLLGF